MRHQQMVPIKIEEIIDKKIGEVRTEAIDLSFGEIVNLHSSKEIIIQPEYQRLFRWSNEQRSRLIESILLELPIPQVFVIENPNGVLELIDGLQRISTVIQFINPRVLDLDILTLEGCDIISELNGHTFEDLPLRLKLRIKRAAVRTVIIKRQSRSILRYEMFKRLITGGAILSPQEIRNCSARMVENGVTFYSFLQKMASIDPFIETTETLPQQEIDQKGDEELVLRFFALKNSENLFRGSVRDWLDRYMEKVLLSELKFDYKEETTIFIELFTLISKIFGAGAFVRYKEGKPAGALAPAYFEAITMGIFYRFDKVKLLPPEKISQAIIAETSSDAFRQFIGSGSSNKEKLRKRIERIQIAIDSI